MLVSKNKIYQDCGIFTLPVPVGAVSGDPVVVSNLPGVLETSRDSGGNASVNIPRGPVFDLSVKGVNDSGNNAVAVGDKLYYVAEDTPKISKKVSGTFFGYALEAVTSGATATINVLLASQANASHAYGTWTFHFNLADIDAGDLVTSFVPHFAGKIIAIDAVATKAASTASKLANLNLEIGTTDVTGGVVALTTAALNAQGKLVAGTAITAENEFAADSLISLEAADVTAFVEGEIDVVITYQTV
jgi:hypothetical protein